MQSQETGTEKHLVCWGDTGVGCERSSLGKDLLCILPLWFSLPLPEWGVPRSPSWTLIFEKRNIKGIKGCYHFHFVIGREPLYIHYPLTADALPSCSTEIEG